MSSERQTVNLALGRIFGMLQRPGQPGDAAEYERCRMLVLSIVDPDNSINIASRQHAHDYGRDRLKGAQGDDQ